MPVISLRQCLGPAAVPDYGVPASNGRNVGPNHAVLQAAEACDVPVFLQASVGARKHTPRAFPKAATALKQAA
jgi:fructose-bisphosphate aldolase class II